MQDMIIRGLLTLLVKKNIKSDPGQALDRMCKVNGWKQKMRTLQRNNIPALKLQLYLPRRELR